MGKVQRFFWVALCIVAFGLFVAPLQAKAGNVTSGTLGDNDGIQWTYDADTKTLTVTGEDSGVYGEHYSPLYSACGDAKKIVMKDCTLHGSASYLFYNLTQVESIVFDNFDTSNVTDMAWMFSGCVGVTELDVSGFDTSNVTNMRGMFGGCESVTALDVSGFNTSNVTSMGSMFASCYKVTALDVSGFDTKNVTNMSYMFSSCSGLTDLDVSNFDTKNVTDMFKMFYNCSSLTALDVSGFDTSKVANMSEMFRFCSNVTALDVSGFDTTNVTNMSKMFFNCPNVTALDVSNFETSNVTDMSYMFAGCPSVTELDVSDFNTTNVTNMSSMFAGCGKVTALGVSNFDTSKVTDMSEMFSSCVGLTALDVSNFDTSNVTSMYMMFNVCESMTELDVSGFDTSKVTNMSNMFAGCEDITGLDVSSFDLSKVETVDQMFFLCNALNILKTPKVIPEGMSIALPGTFVDSKVNETSVLTAEFCNETLRRKVEFSDVPQDQWFYPYVKKAYYNGYMSGTGTDSQGKVIFKPLVNIPREQFVTVLYALEEVNPDSIQYSGRFSDVKATDWFAKPVEWAAQNGIVSGTGNGKFGVGQLITREQMALMLYGYARYKGYDITISTDISSFPDASEVSDWAYDGMRWAIQNGIMSGQKAGDKIYLKPKDNASRAVCATMIVAFAEKY